MNTPPAIRLQDVCFSYRAQEVLHNVTFDVHEKEMVAVVGPNGGGKTTLLRIILGLLTPLYGTARVFGLPPREARCRMGYVPQHLLFDPKFPVTVLDVVRMGLVDRRRAGPYRRSDDEVAMRALDDVRMVDLAKRPFAALSGGQRQRALVAQALVSDPPLLLMDEPTASVDAPMEHKLYELFGRLNKERTIVFVSHNLKVVTSHVTHVLCVNREAEMHAIGDITSSVFQAAYGGDLTVLRHDETCHVIDSSDVLHSPHTAEADRSTPSP